MAASTRGSCCAEWPVMGNCQAVASYSIFQQLKETLFDLEQCKEYFRPENQLVETKNGYKTQPALVPGLAELLFIYIPSDSTVCSSDTFPNSAY